MNRPNPIASPSISRFRPPAPLAPARVRIQVADVRFVKELRRLWIDLATHARACAVAFTGDNEYRLSEEAWVEPDGRLTLQMTLPEDYGELTLTIPEMSWTPRKLC